MPGQSGAIERARVARRVASGQQGIQERSITIRASRCVWVVPVGLVLGALGCTTVQTVDQYDGGPLPRPDRIVVEEFAYSPSQVKLMRGITPELEDALNGSPRTAQQLEVGSKVANVLAEHLVKEIRDMGLPAERGYGDPQPYGNTYTIEGQFLSIDQGNRTERNVIGLGLGRSDVKTLVQLYRDSAEGQRLIEALDVSAESGRKPGMAETMGVGGLTGNLVTAAAVSAAGSLGSETFSATVEADAARTAKNVAKRLRAVFAQQGWVSP
jgi:hypothetical protein